MRLPLYAWVLAGVAALLAVGFFALQRDNSALQERTAALARQNTDLRHEADRATERASLIERRAAELDSQLAATKMRKTTNDTEGVQLARDLHDAQVQLAEHVQHEVMLAAEIAALRQKIVSAGLPLPTDSVLTNSATDAAAQIDAANKRLAQLQQQLDDALARLQEAKTAVVLAAKAEPPPHTVVRVGPKDSFVIIDYGTDHGANNGRLIMLRRGTTVIAYVRISDARPAFSIAQVLPDSLKGQLQPGDLVVLAP